MIRQWFTALGRGEPYAVLVGGLLILLLLSPFVARYGQTWLNIYRFDAGGEASRGTPPFRSYNEFLARAKNQPFRHIDLVAAYKIAALEFPNVRSCLQPNVGDITTDSLKRMDWDKMRRLAEVEVCIFRLLAASEDISHATAWFEHQGFRVPDKFSSANPYFEGDGTMRVYGIWSISKNGPKYNRGGLLNRLLPDMAYAMHVQSFWSPDGQRLLAVEVGFESK